MSTKSQINPLMVPFCDSSGNQITKPDLITLAKMKNPLCILRRIRQHITPADSLTFSVATRSVMLQLAESRKANDRKRAAKRKGGSQNQAFHNAGW